MTSTTRNVGSVDEAISILKMPSPCGVDDDARQVFLALALFGAGRHSDRLMCTALLALIPTLDGYGRALTEHAEDLPSAPII